MNKVVFPTLEEIEKQLGAYLPSAQALEAMTDGEFRCILSKWKIELEERREKRNPYPLLRERISKVLRSHEPKSAKESKVFHLISEFKETYDLK